MIITLPWPPAELFPNQSNRDGGKYPRREAARKYRLAVSKLTAEKEINFKRPPTAMAIDFYPPNNRRDLDGMLSAIKSGIDGIFDALGEDDRGINQIIMVKHPADKINPRVVIVVEEGEEMDKSTRNYTCSKCEIVFDLGLGGIFFDGRPICDKCAGVERDPNGRAWLPGETAMNRRDYYGDDELYGVITREEAFGKDIFDE